MPKLPFAPLAVLIAPAAFAQSAGGSSVDPSLDRPDYHAAVTAPPASPEFTQDRVFGGTRFWLLDPNEYEVEVWLDQKRLKDGSTETLLQAEIEIGLAPHLQLDLY